MAGGHHGHAAAVEEAKVVADRLEQVVRAGGDALPRHPAGIPPDRVDRDRRVETPAGASPIGTEHVAAACPYPGDPDEGATVKIGPPLVDRPVAVRVTRRSEERRVGKECRSRWS